MPVFLVESNYDWAALVGSFIGLQSQHAYVREQPHDGNSLMRCVKMLDQSLNVCNFSRVCMCMCVYVYVCVLSYQTFGDSLLGSMKVCMVDLGRWPRE